MGKTQVYRDQHVEILSLAGKLKAMLDVEKLKQDGAAARTLLSALAGKVTVHLAMEDKSLYPALLASADPTIQAKAKRFTDEMGGIKQALTKYLARYPSGTVIAQSAAGFVKETTAMLAVLGKRVQAEDSDLYVAVDAHR
jgi:hypothetical protein